MQKIVKYIAIALFFSSASVCTASEPELDELQQNPKGIIPDIENQHPQVVVYQQKTVSNTADAFLKHGVGDVAFLAATGARQLSDSDVLRLVFYGIQFTRYYELARANYHATSDAINYKSWPFIYFAVGMAIHAMGDLAFDLPALSRAIVRSQLFENALNRLPIFSEWTGSAQAINLYIADAADAIKLLSVPIAALTFMLALYRFQHDGTFDVLKAKLSAYTLRSRGQTAADETALDRSYLSQNKKRN